MFLVQEVRGLRAACVVKWGVGACPAAGLTRISLAPPDSVRRPGHPQEAYLGADDQPHKETVRSAGLQSGGTLPQRDAGGGGR